jgi:hypothetical protein
MNSIAAFQMARAIDEELRHQAEMRRQRIVPADGDVRLTGRGSWRTVLQFPRFTPTPSKG